MAGGKHILVIRLSAMGDVAMTVPVLRALVFQHPEVKVTVVSREFFRPFFNGIPNVAFFAADVNGRHKGFTGLLRLFGELRRLKPDAVADLHNVLRSNIITSHFRLTGIKTASVDKARTEKKALTRAENKIFKPLVPIVQRHAEVLQRLGFPLDLSAPVFPKKQQLTPEILKTTGEKTAAWLGIAPFAQHEGKVYPADLMQEVINKLSEDSNIRIFLFGGGEAETKKLNHFAAGKPNVLVTAGRLALQQELALISNLDLMLSMDSGNAHIAAMLGVPVVTLWGATHPYAGFMPFGQREENALTADREKFPLLPTSIYGNKKIEGYEDAMHTIKPDEVVHKIYEIINRK